MTYPDPAIQSAAFDFKSQMVQAARAALGEQVSVTWGKGSDVYASQRVMFRDVRARQRPAAIGGHRRREELRLTFEISCRGDSIDGVEVLARRVAEIENVIAGLLRPGVGDPALTRSVISAEIESEVFQDLEQGQEFESKAVVTVRAVKRI